MDKDDTEQPEMDARNDEHAQTGSDESNTEDDRATHAQTTPIVDWASI